MGTFDTRLIGLGDGSRYWIVAIEGVVAAYECRRDLLNPRLSEVINVIGRKELTEQ